MGTGTCEKFTGASSLDVCLVFIVSSDSLLVPHPSLPCSWSDTAAGPGLNALELLQAASQPMGCSGSGMSDLKRFRLPKKCVPDSFSFPFHCEVKRETAERTGQIGGLDNHQPSEVLRGKVPDCALGMMQPWMYGQAGE